MLWLGDIGVSTVSDTLTNAFRPLCAQKGDSAAELGSAEDAHSTHVPGIFRWRNGILNGLANHRRIREVVTASGTTLTELFGVGHITAAMIIAHTHSGDPSRFGDTGRYASYNGSAPVEASEGVPAAT